LSAAVAEFGLLLRGSSYKQNSSFEQALEIAKDAAQHDDHGYRSEFVKLIKKRSRWKIIIIRTKKPEAYFGVLIIVIIIFTTQTRQAILHFS
jgi:hypothetical protein